MFLLQVFHMSEFLEQLRKAIRVSGISRYRIYKATGIDQGQLSKLMIGKAGLSMENVEKLVDFLGLEIIVRLRKRPKRSK